MGSSHGAVRHLFDIPLGDKEIGETIILHVSEDGMPSGGWPPIATSIGPMGGRSGIEGRVHEGRRFIACFHPLQALITHGGEVHLGKTVAIQITRGDAHPPQLMAVPTVIGSVKAWRGVHRPHLFFAAAHIIVPVVRDAQVGAAMTPPIGEEYGKRAEARLKLDCRGIRIASRSQKHVAVAGFKRTVRIVPIDIVANGQRRQPFSSFPSGGEGRAPAITTVDIQRLEVREIAVACSAQQSVFTHSEHHKVQQPIAVDVDWVSADNPRQGECVGCHCVEAEVTAGL